MVTGGVAATLYGEPRPTLDVDVVLHLPRDADVERWATERGLLDLWRRIAFAAG